VADITLENLDEHLSHDFEFEHIVDSGCGHRASSMPTIDIRIIQNRLYRSRSAVLLIIVEHQKTCGVTLAVWIRSKRLLRVD